MVVHLDIQPHRHDSHKLKEFLPLSSPVASVQLSHCNLSPETCLQQWRRFDYDFNLLVFLSRANILQKSHKSVSQKSLQCEHAVSF